MPMARELSIRGAPIHMLQEGRGPDQHLAKRTLELMQLFAEEVTPHFREDAHVDETAGVRRQSRSVSE